MYGPMAIDTVNMPKLFNQETKVNVPLKCVKNGQAETTAPPPPPPQNDDGTSQDCLFWSLNEKIWQVYYYCSKVVGKGRWFCIGLFCKYGPYYDYYLCMWELYRKLRNKVVIIGLCRAWASNHIVFDLILNKQRIVSISNPCAHIYAHIYLPDQNLITVAFKYRYEIHPS